jgi:hypothetical protein
MTRDPVIRLELALDIIDAECAELEQEISEEAAVSNEQLLQLLEAELRALCRFKNTLSLADTNTVDIIIAAYVPQQQEKMIASYA